MGRFARYAEAIDLLSEGVAVSIWLWARIILLLVALALGAWLAPVYDDGSWPISLTWVVLAAVLWPVLLGISVLVYMAGLLLFAELIFPKLQIKPTVSIRSRFLVKDEPAQWLDVLGFIITGYGLGMAAGSIVPSLLHALLFGMHIAAAGLGMVISTRVVCYVIPKEKREAIGRIREQLNVATLTKR